MVLTGVETASLVLAGFPILVNAFRLMVSIVGDGTSSQSLLLRFMRELESEQAICRNNLESLLDGIIPPDAWRLLVMGSLDSAQLMALSNHYEIQLHQRLDHDFANYMSHTGALLQALNTLKKKLQIDQDTGMMPCKDRSSFKQFWPRVKLVLLKQDYEKSLTQIETANRGLMYRLQQSKDMEPKRKERRLRQNRFDLVRVYATSLHQAITSKSIWSCACRDTHTVGLCLDDSADKSNAEPSGPAISPNGHRLLLSIAAVNGCTTPSWYGVNVTPPLVPRPQPSHVIGEQSAFSRGMTLSPSQNPRTSRISDFCSAIRTSEPASCLGSILDEANNHRFNVYLDDTKFGGFGPENRAKSLRNLLETPRGPQDVELDSQDRLHIAVKLASNVLRLQGTPWLTQQWESTDLSVIPSAATAHGAWQLRLDDLFVTHQITAVGSNSNAEVIPTKKGHPRLHQSDVLFSLGITLTELCLGKSISELATLQDVRDTMQTLPFYTADRLKDKVYREWGKIYGDVVRRCLDCTIDVREKDFDDVEFQSAFFDRILSPLKGSLEVANTSWSD